MHIQYMDGHTHTHTHTHTNTDMHSDTNRSQKQGRNTYNMHTSTKKHSPIYIGTHRAYALLGRAANTSTYVHSPS